MNIQRQSLRELHHELSRRDLLRLAGLGLSGLGLAAIVGCGSDDSSGSPTSTPGIVVDPPPETTTIRLSKNAWEPSTAPMYLAEEFLLAEGFTSVEYVGILPATGGVKDIAAGRIDIGLARASAVAAAVDAGDQLVVLAGVHNSAFQLVGNDRVQSLRDLKGKKIWILSREATDEEYSLWVSLLAYVGIDLEREIEFVVLNGPEGEAALAAGTIDALVSWEPYSTLASNTGLLHVVLDSTMDPPWSQYFGGMVTGNSSFVEKNPAATKRALRAILKATDVCAKEPERAAHYLVDKSHTLFSYEEVLDAIKGLSFTAWREFDPDDTMRFYALRLRDAGIVKSTPDELIARATDWRYLNEIKRELGVA